jgi:hypothetical protein
MHKKLISLVLLFSYGNGKCLSPEINNTGSAKRVNGQVRKKRVRTKSFQLGYINLNIA